jgi:hypothetical protein
VIDAETTRAWNWWIAEVEQELWLTDWRHECALCSQVECS